VLRPEQPNGAERKIYRQVGKFRSLMFRYAVQFKTDHPQLGADSIDSEAYTRNFEDKVVKITPAMVAEVRKLMKDNEFDLTEEDYKEAEPLLRQWMYYYIADACFDRNTAQRVLTDYDQQLLKAVELIEAAPSAGNFVETLLAGRTLPDTLDQTGLAR
jgi:hypothetical protein